MFLLAVDSGRRDQTRLVGFVPSRSVCENKILTCQHSFTRPTQLLRGGGAQIVRIFLHPHTCQHSFAAPPLLLSRGRAQDTPPLPLKLYETNVILYMDVSYTVRCVSEIKLKL